MPMTQSFYLEPQWVLEGPWVGLFIYLLDLCPAFLPEGYPTSSVIITSLRNKTKVLSFGRRPPKRVWRINGRWIEQVTASKYLGVMLHSPGHGQPTTNMWLWLAINLPKQLQSSHKPKVAIIFLRQLNYLLSLKSKHKENITVQIL